MPVIASLGFFEVCGTGRLMPAGGGGRGFLMLTLFGLLITLSTMVSAMTHSIYIFTDFQEGGMAPLTKAL